MKILVVGSGGREHAICRAFQKSKGTEKIFCADGNAGIGEIAETVAIKRAFGDSVKKLAVSSTKSTTGHMIGAAGAAEAVFTILALQDQVVPPTINLENQDPACDLDYTPNVARQAKLEAALSNSFGFGGTNGTVVFKRLR